MTWRDGVHLAGTPIWCDARRRREICFVSSAERIGRAGHGQLIGTVATLALLGAADDGHLAVPVRQRFTLGTLRLELIPSGHGLGAAALHVDAATRSVLYAGPVRTAPGGIGELADVRTCDAVVVAAPFGMDALPPLAATVADTIAWTRDQLAAERHPVLLVDSVTDALEVAGRLGRAEIPVAGSHALRTAALRLATLTTELPAIAAPGKEPRALIWLDADRTGLSRVIADRPHATALVSGRARGADGFAWATAAAGEPLLAWIDATGARAVYVTGAGAEEVVAAVGPRARLLGPPHQMTLFPREAAPRS